MRHRPGRFAERIAGPRPLVLDAAIGTRLIAAGLDPECDDGVFWNLRSPEKVAELHARDVAAGADAVVTNSFGACRPRLSAFVEAPDVEWACTRAVRLARSVAGFDRLVLGSLGPYPALLGDPSAYVEPAGALVDEGVDALLLETHTFEQAMIALEALREIDAPVIVNMFAWPFREGAVGELTRAGASAVGLNCTAGLPGLIGAIERIASSAIPLVARPAAGRPGEPYDSPEAFAAIVPRLVANGVRLIGGCCGTTEAHVVALRGAVDRL